MVIKAIDLFSTGRKADLLADLSGARGASRWSEIMEEAAVWKMSRQRGGGSGKEILNR